MVGVEAFHKIGYVVIGFVKLDLRDEDVIDPIDLAFIEVGIVCTGAAAIVNYTKALAQVVKEIGTRAHKAVHLSLPQEVSYELAEARRHHRTCQTEEDRDILIHHSFPDAQGCAELASLKAHLAHIPYQIGYTPVLHGYCSPYLFAVANIIMTVILIHFVPLRSCSQQFGLETFKDYPISD